jgi:hypothetical protein
VSGRGECELVKLQQGATSMLRLTRRAGGLGQDVADLIFELGIKAARWKRNWSWLCCACSTHVAAKNGRFPGEPCKNKMLTISQ